MSEHTVRSYDDELAHLTTIILRMGGLAEAQLGAAMTALTSLDVALAEKVVAADPNIDELEKEAQTFTVRLLALRQPMAVDLRHIVAALKISAELERIGDYAANIAKRVGALSRLPDMAAITHRLADLAAMVQRIIKDVLDAYGERDVDAAVAAWKRDREVDDACAALFHEVTMQMTQDPRLISAGIHYLFMAKNIERIGDHATNIAETLHFLVKGATIAGIRPKGQSIDPGAA